MIYHPRGEGSLLDARQTQLQALRGSQLAMIFQDPMTALNPVLTVGEQLLEAVNAHAKLIPGRGPGAGRRACCGGSASRPRSGGCATTRSSSAAGMLQRALIAIALASSPRLLLADEPTTSLDVIIQDQILSLLLELQQDTGMSMILVSHDLAVITEVCDRIIVMYAGQVVEEGPAADIITAPRHPYTRALLDALPQAEQRGQLRSIPGSPPSLIDVPGGCRFAPRCRARGRQVPVLGYRAHPRPAGPARRARCWRHEEMEEVTRMAGKRLGIGVVGAGRWANWAHLPGWARDQRCRIVAVCDIDRERAAAAAGRMARTWPPATTPTCSSATTSTSSTWSPGTASTSRSTGRPSRRASTC